MPYIGMNNSTEQLIEWVRSDSFKNKLHALQLKLIVQHGFGFMDGGCYTLAQSIHNLYPAETELYCISRTFSILDHLVIKIKDRDLYLDCDGLQTSQQLFHKMLHGENVDCSALFSVDASRLKDEIIGDFIPVIESALRT